MITHLIKFKAGFKVCGKDAVSRRVKLQCCAPYCDSAPNPHHEEDQTILCYKSYSAPNHYNVEHQTTLCYKPYSTLIHYNVEHQTILCYKPYSAPIHYNVEHQTILRDTKTYARLRMWCVLQCATIHAPQFTAHLHYIRTLTVVQSSRVKCSWHQ